MAPKTTLNIKNDKVKTMLSAIASALSRKRAAGLVLSCKSTNKDKEFPMIPNMQTEPMKRE